MANPKGAGRKPLELDQKAFESLCGIQCTQQEICDYFDIDEDTLNAWCKRTYRVNFSEVFRQKRGKGKVSLRRAQWRQAVEKENITMLIWLGKNFLNQTDKIESVTEEKLQFVLPEFLANDKKSETD